jgi:hypothetical protein
MQDWSNLPEVSEEEYKETLELWAEVNHRQRQEIALWRRKQEPMASYLLRELLLDQIRPPDFRELFKL